MVEGPRTISSSIHEVYLPVLVIRRLAASTAHSIPQKKTTLTTEGQDRLETTGSVLEGQFCVFVILIQQTFSKLRYQDGRTARSKSYLDECISHEGNDSSESSYIRH